MKELTDGELIQSALRPSELDEDSHDVRYYQQSHMLVDGDYKVHIQHLYFHYQNWSSSPISMAIFYDILNLSRKVKNTIFINKNLCTINLELNLGNYVRHQKSKEKKERLRQVSCLKPKTQCED